MSAQHFQLANHMSILASSSVPRQKIFLSRAFQSLSVLSLGRCTLINLINVSPLFSGRAASSKILDKLFSESLGKSLATPPSAPLPPFHGIHSIKTLLLSPLSIKGDLSSLHDLQPSGSETLIFGIQDTRETTHRNFRMS